MLSVSSAMCAPGGVLLLSLPGACIRNSRYLNETVSLPPSSAFPPVFPPSLYFCHSAAAGLLHPSQSILPHILPLHRAKKPISAYPMRVASLTEVLADKQMGISGAEGYAQASVPSGDESEEHTKALPVGPTQVLPHPSLHVRSKVLYDCKGICSLHSTTVWLLSSTTK
jgi:hypothetical protein